MLPALAQILIGWPAILLSLFISAYGIYTRQHNLLIIGAALIVGFSWYLTAMPLLSLKVIGCFLPLLHITAIVFVRRDKRLFAGLLLLPQVAVTVYFGALVLMQHS